MSRYIVLNNERPALGGCGGLSLTVVVTGLVGWLTHLFWFLALLSSGDVITWQQAALGLIGIFLFPIGCLHGIGLWFGLSFW